MLMRTITYVQRPLWLRLLKPIRIAMLTREIKSAEGYVSDTREGGVLNKEQIAKLEANIGTTRALLVWWVNA